MFRFIRQFFRKKPEIVDFSAPIEEFWQTDFLKEKNRRFVGEIQSGYASSFTDKGLLLSLERQHIFAWTVNPCYEYRDLTVEALVDFSVNARHTAGIDPGKAGHCAFGFLLRYTTESNYYSVLVSDQGMVRMDAVFNGNPMTLLPWTAGRAEGSEILSDSSSKDDMDLPYRKNPKVFSLRIILQGTGCTIILNDNWLAYVEDDTIQSYGKLAFAGQNWDSAGKAEGLLQALAVESRPLEVETLHLRWNSFIPVPAAARIRLAESYYAAGRLVPALIELSQAAKTEKPDTHALLLAGRMYLAEQLYDEAEKRFCAVLEAEPENREALENQVSLLYVQNRYGDMEALLSEKQAVAETSPTLYSLKGHLCFHLSRWTEAADSYRSASRMEPEQPLHFLHLSRSLKADGREPEAQESLDEAARLFFVQDNYEELAELLPVIEVSGGAKGRGAAGKYYFSLGETEKAEALFLPLIAEQTADSPELSDNSELFDSSNLLDSSILFLQALIYAAKGERQQAIHLLHRAAEMEPGYGLYRFRLAENLFLDGQDPGAELAAALELSPENGWVWNLASQTALKKGDVEQAQAYAEKAKELLPDEPAALRNLADILRRLGKTDAETEQYYTSALNLDPDNIDILLDRAEACLGRGELNEADDLLTQALDIGDSPRVYGLLGHTSRMKGEYPRCEIVYRKGLEDFPGDPELLFGLGELYLFMQRYTQAREIEAELRRLGQALYAEKLESVIRERAMRKLSCSECSREWFVPREIPHPRPLRLEAEPPDDLPAGICPDCGAIRCIACAKPGLEEDGRFRCTVCGSALKLSEPGLMWLLSEWAEQERR
ncbi:MAG: tetratricopeptide repeat protein [Spirochaetaceae bacterium]|jgi:tetratricopeptide (TPR) repeat protein|nr:tetratricopeptide repeat protein [Spirochaetaceae bacterium]